MKGSERRKAGYPTSKRIYRAEIRRLDIFKMADLKSSPPQQQQQQQQLRPFYDLTAPPQVKTIYCLMDFALSLLCFAWRAYIRLRECIYRHTFERYFRMPRLETVMELTTNGNWFQNEYFNPVFIVLLGTVCEVCCGSTAKKRRKLSNKARLQKLLISSLLLSSSSSPSSLLCLGLRSPLDGVG